MLLNELIIEPVSKAEGSSFLKSEFYFYLFKVHWATHSFTDSLNKYFLSAHCPRRVHTTGSEMHPRLLEPIPWGRSRQQTDEHLRVKHCTVMFAWKIEQGRDQRAMDSVQSFRQGSQRRSLGTGPKRDWGSMEQSGDLGESVPAEDAWGQSPDQHARWVQTQKEVSAGDGAIWAQEGLGILMHMSWTPLGSSVCIQRNTIVLFPPKQTGWGVLLL